MSTYEELSLIVSVALLIVAILSYTHKKVCALAHTCAERGCRQATSTLCASAHNRYFSYDRKCNFLSYKK